MIISQQAPVEIEITFQFSSDLKGCSRIGFDHGGLRFLETRHLPISAFSWASEQHDKIGRRSSSNKYFPIHAATFQPRWAGEGSRKHKTLSPTPATICTGLLLLLLFVLDFYSFSYSYSCSYSSCYYFHWTSTICTLAPTPAIICT